MSWPPSASKFEGCSCQGKRVSEFRELSETRCRRQAGLSVLVRLVPARKGARIRAWHVGTISLAPLCLSSMVHPDMLDR